MLTFRMIAILTLALLLAGNAVSLGSAGASYAKRTAAVAREQTGSTEIKVLAEGAHSNIQDSFVAIVRDAETYAALRKLDSTLPDLSEDFFKTDAVVAAFLGERRTGGYSVEITRTADTIHVAEKRPGKGLMLIQMITSPFKVVTIAGGASSALSLTVDDTWQERLFPFNISSGQFKTTGGIAGAMRSFKLEGSLGIMVESSNLVTLLFSVRGTDPAKKRALVDSATGVVTNAGQVIINRLSAGTLVDRPNSGLTATGQLTNSDSEVLLILVSQPSMIADGYRGTGTLSASMVQAKPRMR